MYDGVISKGDKTMRFTLIGRPTMVFVAVKTYNAAGFIPSVVGVSECGRYTTCARVEDVNLVADVTL